MARKPKHEEHENHERWLVSYADFITLLFAFFTVLYATSQQDTKKEQEFEKSVRQSFNAVATGSGSGGAGGGANNESNAITPDLDSFPKARAGVAEMEDYIKAKVQKEMKPEEYSQVIEDIRQDPLGVRIKIAAAALFAPGTADLREEAYAPLQKLGALLKLSKRKMIIEGHTDNEPFHNARYPSNWEFSAARATKVTRYLLSRHGIAGKSITPTAFADQRPIAPNDTAEHRARNQRIEIIVQRDMDEE